MAWGKAGRPTMKMCPGYGRKPHLCDYNTDFPRVRRKLKYGEIADYAGTYCYDCRNAYNRELRRMNNRLAGKATRPQDVPWKRYRKKQEETFMRGVPSRDTRRPSQPFLWWLERWRKRNGMSIEQVCRNVGVSSRTLRRWRKDGYLQLYTAEKFLTYARHPRFIEVYFEEESLGDRSA